MVTNTNVCVCIGEATGPVIGPAGLDRQVWWCYHFLHLFTQPAPGLFSSLSPSCISPLVDTLISPLCHVSQCWSVSTCIRPQPGEQALVPVGSLAGRLFIVLLQVVLILNEGNTARNIGNANTCISGSDRNMKDMNI